MRFRIELFVRDLPASIAFYERALGFEPIRREPTYASLARGDAELGLAAVTRLPVAGAGAGFTQERVAAGKGAGVEIVLEVHDVEAALAAAQAAGARIVEPLRARPWGLRDFRLVDPDGFYLRVTTPPPAGA